MKKSIQLVAAALFVCMLLTTPAMAANHFSFKFNDLYNYTYNESWTKANGSNAYTITLSRMNGLSMNTMSSTNIFGCRMKDMSIVPVVDDYHTFSNYVSNYAIGYRVKPNTGDTMKLGGKKDSASTSTAQLRISGYVTP
ncbi:hypothetical protein [Porcincola intestinalis]|uniref:Uncharacterized protein n=1 Tax=Porcincola intestinalis TaxID=2606632 RepID=A0A6L5X4B1_9FIRM|nr:hypothetical protein [Porcincola intestinalis]MCI6768501.1 hypothetical protein [Lachnospiraceae bacterium]MDD7060055.1 hypothetical protein [Porcincola intestinalis]MDY4205009.1 hypothetical protein [Porcincola intestinalis]MDY5282734.1 hypothetical protein [Porcincola intestinalis]MDY5579051.1 hypothetical protein [Porcincola intestinalis]